MKVSLELTLTFDPKAKETFRKAVKEGTSREEAAACHLIRQVQGPPGFPDTVPIRRALVRGRIREVLQAAGVEEENPAQPPKGKPAAEGTQTPDPAPEGSRRRR